MARTAAPSLLLLVALCGGARAADIFVDPIGGDDTSALADRSAPLRTVRAAKAAVRAALLRSPSDVTVHLLPGTHHVGDEPLTLGPEDGGSGDRWVTWRSADPSSPAVVGAPIRVTGPWTPHPTVKGALVAPLPANVTAGSSLRHFWVSGQRAERPLGIPAGQGPRGPKMSTFNLTMTDNTSMYPEGSKYDFSRTGLDPSTWPNPQDVEFVFTSCASFNCWVEPRCTVGAVEGSIVSLKQADNSSCFWRLYYFGIGWGGAATGGGLWRKFPTHLENLATNWTQPGQWYYDRKAATIGYIPRAGESAATLAATATTASTEVILAVKHTQNLRWEGVRFE